MVRLYLNGANVGLPDEDCAHLYDAVPRKGVTLVLGTACGGPAELYLEADANVLELVRQVYAALRGIIEDREEEAT